MATIVQPPRAFQLSIVYEFPEDARSDLELGALLTRSVSTTLEVSAFAKGASIQRLATLSAAAPSAKAPQ